MNLVQFKSFSQVEKEQCIKLYESEQWTFKYPLPADLFDIEFYYNLRFDQRKKNTNVTWPEKLSTREKTVCKINMLRRILTYVSTDRTADTRILHRAVDTFLKDINQEILAFKATRDSTYRGLDPEIAKVLNALYTSLSNSFKNNNFKETNIDNQ